MILGGGIAGLEALLALADLAGERTAITLVAPFPDFLYKPTTVEEPFTGQPAEHRELGPLAADLGASFVLGSARAVDYPARRVELGEGEPVPFESLIVCVGGRATDPYRGATTFRATGEPLAIDPVIETALGHGSRTLAFVVPPGVTWPLPLYELALMTRRRADEAGRADLRIALLSPEDAPLAAFGVTASEAIADLLGVRRIEFAGGSHVVEDDEGRLSVIPQHEALDAGAVVALPLIEGPGIEGLPCDEHGFVPIDEHARVRGMPGVYAAGDGTTFPVKQGGIATQQADAAVEHLAASLGAEMDPAPFEPVLRGQLIVGGESLNIRHDLEGGHGEGEVSLDYLWWPPHKVSGRYLAPWLAHETPHREPEPPTHPIDVEVSHPDGWHSTPMAIDPDGPPSVG